MKEVNGYILSRSWFDFSFENASKVTASHTALYLWLIEINNRMGWCLEFQITAKECMQGMSCKSYNTYKKCLDDLTEWGFVLLKRKSLNQFQTNVIALSKNNKAQYKALDNALVKHNTTQSESTKQSTGDIQQTINHKQVSKSFTTVEIFEDQGFTFGLLPDASKSMNEFLQYKANRRETVADGKVVEKMVKEMMGKSANQKHWIRMIDFTISKQAKNIITDIDLTETFTKKEKTDADKW